MALERSHPIAASSTVVLVPSLGLRNLVDGKLFTNNPGGLTPTPDGLGVTASMATACNVPVSVATFPFAYYFIQTRNGSGNWIGLSSTANNANYTFVRGDLSSTDSLTFLSDNDINASPAPSSRPHCYMVVFRSATDRVFVIDGVVVGTASASKSTVFDRFNIGGIERTAGQWLAQASNQLTLAGLSQGLLISNEAACAFTREPWRIFRPVRRFALLAAAAGEFTYAGSGGMSFSGAATAAASANYVMSSSGGLTLAGSAPASQVGSFAMVGAGGLVLGGAASATAAYAYAMAGSGGLSLGGAATILQTSAYAHTAAGGMTLGGTGSAQVGSGFDFVASGGLTLSGAAGASSSAAYVVVGTGGLAFSGAAVYTQTRVYAAAGSGGIAFGGTAAASSSGPAGSGATAEEVWAFTLSNGQTAGDTLVAVQAMLRELYQIHGLELGSPLTVTQTLRTAAGIVQAVADLAGTVTVTRQ